MKVSDCGCMVSASPVRTALMTEVFWFSSEFVGFYRKRPTCFRSAIPFIYFAISIPIIGALMLAWLKIKKTFLKAA